MQWTSALAIYLLFWFGVLFVVLPFHAHAARRDPDADSTPRVPGAEPGAPPSFRPGRAALHTTLIAGALFALYHANYVNGWIGAKVDLEALGAPPLPR